MIEAIKLVYISVHEKTHSMLTGFGPVSLSVIPSSKGRYAKPTEFQVQIDGTVSQWEHRL